MLTKKSLLLFLRLGTDKHIFNNCSSSSLAQIKKPIKSTLRKDGLACYFCGKLFPNESILNLHLGRRHAIPVSETLKQNPLKTYKAIFGDHYKHLSDTELRYPDGLIVTLKGEDRGNWFSFTQGLGGGPLKAIQHEHGFNFRQAMEFAAKLTGMTPEQLKQLQSESIQGLTAQRPSTLVGSVPVSQKKLQNVETSKNIWAITQDLRGSLAEVYLVKHRRISPETIGRLAFRYMPRNEQYQDLIHGEIVSQPALVVPVQNPAGELTGIQRIFLNESTGNKCTQFDYSKKSKGLLKGSAAIVQRGIAGSVVYVVEGAETGASVASVVGSKATVLASLSVSLLQEMGESALAFRPREVVLAADNDFGADTQLSTRKAFERLKRELEAVGVKVRLAMPQLPLQQGEGRKNVDWNDVLKELGPDIVREQLSVE